LLDLTIIFSRNREDCLEAQDIPVFSAAKFVATYGLYAGAVGGVRTLHKRFRQQKALEILKTKQVRACRKTGRI
jgi:hypothetical protein